MRLIHQKFTKEQAWLLLGYTLAITVKFSTHSVGGLSENDFICAAKVNAAAT